MSDPSADQVLSPLITVSTNPSVSVRPTIKTIWHWVLYFLCLFLFVEVSLQVFYRFTTGSYLYVRDKPPLWASDPHSGWTNRPNLSYRHATPEFAADIYTNSEGFRVSANHEEYQKNKPYNSFRVLLVGPSFAFGWGVNYEDTFGAQLQHMLTARNFDDSSKIEVLNHGVPGLPAANELEWLKQVGKDYCPNLVIHFAYGSLEESSKPEANVMVRNGLVVRENVTAKDLLWGYAKNSATIFYTGIGITILSRVLASDRSSGEVEGAGRRMRNSSSFSLQDPIVKDSIAYYGTLRDTVEAAGAQLLIVFFPLAYVVHQEDQARWSFQGVENIEKQVQFNEAFTRHLNSIGIRTVNLTGPFIESARIENARLYYWLDVHWTELGNTVSAQVVSQYLMETLKRMTVKDIPSSSDKQERSQAAPAGMN